MKGISSRDKIIKFFGLNWRTLSKALCRNIHLCVYKCVRLNLSVWGGVYMERKVKRIVKTIWRTATTTFLSPSSTSPSPTMPSSLAEPESFHTKSFSVFWRFSVAVKLSGNLACLCFTDQCRDSDEVIWKPE